MYVEERNEKNDYVKREYGVVQSIYSTKGKKRRKGLQTREKKKKTAIINLCVGALVKRESVGVSKRGNTIRTERPIRPSNATERKYVQWGFTIRVTVNFKRWSVFFLFHFFPELRCLRSTQAMRVYSSHSRLYKTFGKRKGKKNVV